MWEKEQRTRFVTCYHLTITRNALEPVKKKMRTIRSDHHNVYTYEMNKIALSAFDDKRWVLEDGVSTLAYGHYKTHLVA